MAENLKNRCETVRESGEWSVLVVGKKEMVPPWVFQLAWELRAYTPSKDKESDEFLKCAVRN